MPPLKTHRSNVATTQKREVCHTILHTKAPKPDTHTAPHSEDTHHPAATAKAALRA